jgi:hypothetical protein
VLSLVLACVLLLSACSPDDITGVTLSETGVPALTNCGAYFRGVMVSDAETSRLVWAAAKSPGSSEYGVGDIVVGVLPESDWTDVSALELDPVPSTWRFEIARLGYREPLTLTVANSELSADQVVIPETGKAVPADKFIGKTCGYDPPIPRAMQRTVGLALLVIAALVAAALIGRRRGRPR